MRLSGHKYQLLHGGHNRRCIVKTCRARRAGTLLEVLISLLIVVMIMQVVSGVAARMRSSHEMAQTRNQSIDAAVRWRLARQAGESWAQGTGEAGAFPERTLTWRLLALEGTVQGREEPDKLWRMLLIQKSGDANAQYRLPMRLPDPERPQATTRSGVFAPGQTSLEH